MSEQKGAERGVPVALDLWHHVPVQGLLHLWRHHSLRKKDAAPATSAPVPALGSRWGAGRGRRFGFQPPGTGCCNPGAAVFSGLRGHRPTGPGVGAGLDLAPRGAELRPERRNPSVASGVTDIQWATVPENAPREYECNLPTTNMEMQLEARYSFTLVDLIK